VDPDSVGVTVERGTLTIRAERTPHSGKSEQVIVAERPQASFTRQPSSSEGVDSENLTAGTTEKQLPKQASPRHGNDVLLAPPGPSRLYGQTRPAFMTGPQCPGPVRGGGQPGGVEIGDEHLLQHVPVLRMSPGSRLEKAHSGPAWSACR
jgi:hypothetical protein